MNREIKFRGKRVDNGIWVYGYYFKTPLTIENFEAGFIGGKTRHCIADNRGVVYEVISETVSQFIGMYDNTVWFRLSDEEKMKFWNENCSEDGRTIMYPTIESIEQLWKGREIYEKDILQYYSKSKFIVKFDELMVKCPIDKIVIPTMGYCGVMIGDKKEKICPLGPTERWAKIIGNTIDNPELLEV